MKTSMLRSVSLLALASCALAAQATVIDFEGLPAGNLASIGGVTFTNASVLIAGQGLNVVNYPPHSGVAVIGIIRVNPLEIVFGSGQASVGAYVRTGDGPLTLEAYSGTTLIGVVTTPFATNNEGSVPSYFLSISGSNITSVRFFDNGIFGNSTLDDLTFSSIAAVPGPMAALPFALMALRRRKKA